MARILFLIVFTCPFLHCLFSSNSGEICDDTGDCEVTLAGASFRTMDNGRYWIRTLGSDTTSRSVVDEIGYDDGSEAGEGDFLEKALYTSLFFSGGDVAYRNRTLSNLKDSSSVGAYQVAYEAYQNQKVVTVTWKLIMTASQKYVIWVASFENTGPEPMEL